MERSEAMALKTRLAEVFAIHGVSVGVGLTDKGVAIRSQDPAVDASNVGDLRAYPEVDVPCQQREEA